MVGEYIKQVRESRHLKTKILAGALNISVSTLNRIENNTVDLTVVRLIQIADFLEVSIEEFFDEKYLSPSTNRSNPSSLNLPNRSAYIQYIVGQNDLLENNHRDLILMFGAVIKTNEALTKRNNELCQFILDNFPLKGK